MRKRKKVEQNDTEEVPNDNESSFGGLQPIDDEEVRECSLEELKAKYGNTLRIATDHQTCFTAITGSHIRVRVFRLGDVDIC